MKRYFVILVILFSAHLIAQEVKQVCGEYVYIASDNLSVEQAQKEALQKAKIQIIADNFGTSVSQSNNTTITSHNGESSVDFFSIGSTEVKGEWIADTKEPSYQISYEQGSLVVHVSICGKARTISNNRIPIEAQILCNGTELRFERSDFYEGDRLYLRFLSSVSGYLCMYLVDEEPFAYCMLPYSSEKIGAQIVDANKEYLFFSSVADKKRIVDEYVMTCSHEGEINTLIIIYSPVEFSKPTDTEVAPGIRGLSYKDLQKWLIQIQTRDDKVSVIRKGITLKKLRK